MLDTHQLTALLRQGNAAHFDEYFPPRIGALLKPIGPALEGRLSDSNLRESVASLLSGSLRTPDDLDALGHKLLGLQLDEAADVAFLAAASLEADDGSIQETWGGPFNGQQRRQELFASLITALQVTAIVETGSFRGSSTQFMAGHSGLPVFSCEINPRFFFYTRERLKPFANTTVFRQDSRAFLADLFARKDLPAGTVFFYLDAHWSEDMPLWDELNIILSSGVPSVVLIDDFRVPGDIGYTFDDYGPGKCLCTQDLRKGVAPDLTLFFPRPSSAAETGMKRGSVVVARGEIAKQIAANVGSLEEIDWRQAILLDAATSELATGSLPDRTAAAAAAAARQERAVSTLQAVIREKEEKIDDLERHVTEYRNLCAKLETEFLLEQTTIREERESFRQQQTSFEKEQISFAEERISFAEERISFAEERESAQERLNRMTHYIQRLNKSKWTRLGLRLRLLKVGDLTPD